MANAFLSACVLQLLPTLKNCLTDCFSLPLPKSKMQYESLKIERFKTPTLNNKKFITSQT